MNELKLFRNVQSDALVYLIGEGVASHSHRLGKGHAFFKLDGLGFAVLAHFVAPVRDTPRWAVVQGTEGMPKAYPVSHLYDGERFAQLTPQRMADLAFVGDEALREGAAARTKEKDSPAEDALEVVRYRETGDLFYVIGPASLEWAVCAGEDMRVACEGKHYHVRMASSARPDEALVLYRALDEGARIWARRADEFHDPARFYVVKPVELAHMAARGGQREAHASAPRPEAQPGNVYRHLGTGGLYRVLVGDLYPAQSGKKGESLTLAHGGIDYAVTLESDVNGLTHAVIYQGADGRVWLRRHDEFNDPARFEQVSAGMFEAQPHPPAEAPAPAAPTPAPWTVGEFKTVGGHSGAYYGSVDVASLLLTPAEGNRAASLTFGADHPAYSALLAFVQALAALGES